MSGRHTAKCDLKTRANVIRLQDCSRRSKENERGFVGCDAGEVLPGWGVPLPPVYSIDGGQDDPASVQLSMPVDSNENTMCIRHVLNHVIRTERRSCAEIPGETIR